MKEKISGLIAHLEKDPRKGNHTTNGMSLSWSSVQVNCSWFDERGEPQRFSLAAKNLKTVEVSRWRWKGDSVLLARLIRRHRPRHMLYATLRSTDGFELTLCARVFEPELLEGLPFRRVSGTTVSSRVLFGVLSTTLLKLGGALEPWDEASQEEPVESEVSAVEVRVFYGKSYEAQLFSERLTQEGILTRFETQNTINIDEGDMDLGRPGFVFVQDHNAERAQQLIEAWRTAEG